MFLFNLTIFTEYSERLIDLNNELILFIEKKLLFN